MTPVNEKLLETLEELHLGEIEQFKWLLQHLQMKDLPRISRSRIERAYGFDLVDLMVEIYGQQSVEVTREVLKKMSRMDLVQRLSDTSSGSKGKLCEKNNPIQFQYETFGMRSRVLFYFNATLFFHYSKYILDSQAAI